MPDPPSYASPIIAPAYTHYERTTPNPYPVPQPQRSHPVWILDCKTCGTFLTNRGMQAVLLLRPSVPLYSTDALPVNCSTWSEDSDAFRRSVATQRTCECLTQSLCCHGCGSTVGYSIVSPCSRCTSSVSPGHSSANGHRFVFHSSEIVSTKRRYISGELGVNPFEPPISTLPQWSTQLGVNYAYYHPHNYSPIPPPLEPADLFFRYSTSPSSFSPSHSTSSLPALVSPSESPGIQQRWLQPSDMSVQLYPSVAMLSAPRRDGFYRLSPHADPHMDSDQKPIEGSPESSASSTRSKKLQAGDVLHWHHLTSSGEIPRVVEDARARCQVQSIDDTVCR